MPRVNPAVSCLLSGGLWGPCAPPSCFSPLWLLYCASTSPAKSRRFLKTLGRARRPGCRAAETLKSEAQCVTRHPPQMWVSDVEAVLSSMARQLNASLRKYPCHISGNNPVRFPPSADVSRPVKGVALDYFCLFDRITQHKSHTMSH